jgi:hypothetical protein|uniref:Uncharacterized protein n=1 Tax=viral metagenome TaxID=1070528 RepID=A0A6C0BWX7_9ZZZZ
MIHRDNIENFPIVYNKNGFIIKKSERNNYITEFEIENKNLYMEKLLHLSLIDILYSVNKDVVDIYKLKVVETNDNYGEANVFVIFKHLFADIGIPQYHSFLNIKIKKTLDESFITFYIKSNTNYENINEYIDDDEIYKQTEQLKVKNVTCYCKLITPHKIKVENHIYLNNQKLVVVDFIEKICFQLLYKMFIRSKVFIEMMYK